MFIGDADDMDCKARVAAWHPDVFVPMRPLGQIDGIWLGLRVLGGLLFDISLSRVD